MQVNTTLKEIRFLNFRLNGSTLTALRLISLHGLRDITLPVDDK